MWTSSWMTPDLVSFRDQVRRFVQAEVVPHQERWAEQQRVDRELWNKGGALGILCADIPEEYGGSGGTFAHQAVVFQELAYGGDSAFNIAVHAILANYILHQGTEEQKKHWLPRMASGELVGAIAMSEPGAGSDLQAIRTTARRDGDHFVVNGSKTFISNGALADLLLVVARTERRRRRRRASHCSSSRRRTRPATASARSSRRSARRRQDTCELFFDDVRVPAANVVGGKLGKGFAQLMTELPYERLIVAISAVCSSSARSS